MRYPGGKNSVFRTLINLMPHHQTYVEPFLGSGAILRNKAPVQKNIGIDLDERAIFAAKKWSKSNIDLFVGNGIEFLEKFPFSGEDFIYCDPPYLHSTRRSPRIYKHEMSDLDHERLLSVLLTLPCKVMLSGYQNSLYATKLHKWQVTEIDVATHVGIREEKLWLNYEPPTVPYDIRYLGDNFRQREQIQRRHQRLLSKIERLPVTERALLWSTVSTKYQDEINSVSSTLQTSGRNYG